MVAQWNSDKFQIFAILAHFLTQQHHPLKIISSQCSKSPTNKSHFIQRSSTSKRMFIANKCSKSNEQTEENGVACYFTITQRTPFKTKIFIHQTIIIVIFFSERRKSHGFYCHADCVNFSNNKCAFWMNRKFIFKMLFYIMRACLLFSGQRHQQPKAKWRNLRFSHCFFFNFKIDSTFHSYRTKIHSLLKPLSGKWATLFFTKNTIWTWKCKCNQIWNQRCENVKHKVVNKNFMDFCFFIFSSRIAVSRYINNKRREKTCLSPFNHMTIKYVLHRMCSVIIKCTSLEFDSHIFFCWD